MICFSNFQLMLFILAFKSSNIIEGLGLNWNGYVKAGITLLLFVWVGIIFSLRERKKARDAKKSMTKA